MQNHIRIRKETFCFCPIQILRISQNSKGGKVPWPLPEQNLKKSPPEYKKKTENFQANTKFTFTSIRT